MKRNRWPHILIAAVAILLVFAFTVVFTLVLKEQEENDKKEKESQSAAATEGGDGYHDLEHPLVLTNLSPDAVMAFTLGGYRYVRTDDGFVYEEAPDMPLDPQAIDGLLEDLTNIQTNYLVDKVEGGDTYGFEVVDEPTYVLEDVYGEKVKMWIGVQCDLDDRLYVKSSLHNGIYLANFDESALYYSDPYTLIMLDHTYHFEPSAILDVKVKDKDGNLLYELPYLAEDTRDTWSFIGTPETSPSCVPEHGFKPTAEDLALWQLDDPLVVEVLFIDTNADEGVTRTVTYRLGGVEQKQYHQSVYLQIDRIVYQTYITDATAEILNGLRAENAD